MNVVRGTSTLTTAGKDLGLSGRAPISGNAHGLFEKNPRVWAGLTVDQFLARCHGTGCLVIQAELTAFVYPMAISS